VSPGMIEPQEAVERALAASRSDDCVVIAEETSSANLRWAGNTLTTNGVSRSRQLTVIAIDRRADGACVGIISRAGVRPDQIEEVVREAEHEAAEASPAEDQAPVIGADQAGSFGIETTSRAGAPRQAGPRSASCAVSRPRSARRCARPRPRTGSCTGLPNTTWSARSWAPRAGCGGGMTSRPGGSS
jgi:hypothetical protein